MVNRGPIDSAFDDGIESAQRGLVLARPRPPVRRPIRQGTARGRPGHRFPGSSEVPGPFGAPTGPSDFRGRRPIGPRGDPDACPRTAASGPRSPPAAACRVHGGDLDACSGAPTQRRTRGRPGHRGHGAAQGVTRTLDIGGIGSDP